MPLLITYDGQEYEFDELDLDTDEAETIQKYVGRSLGDWSNGLQTCEVKSIRALWWILRKRAGVTRAIAATPPAGFKPIRLWSAWLDAVKAENDRLTAEQAAKEAQEAQEDDGVDPTSPAPSPAPAGTPTTPATTTAALLSPPG